MITKAVIDNLYKKYRRRPDSPDELNLGILFGDVFETHALAIDEDNLVIGSIDPSSPFHKIPLRHIHEIVEFADHIAIVLHSSIIFLKKDTPGVSMHVRQPSLSLGERLKRVIKPQSR